MCPSSFFTACTESKSICAMKNNADLAVLDPLIDRLTHRSIDRIAVIDRDRPQTFDPQDQSTSDRFLKSPSQPTTTRNLLIPLIQKSCPKFRDKSLNAQLSTLNPTLSTQVPAITNSNPALPTPTHAIDRSLIDPDRPQRIDPQQQSTTDRFLNSSGTSLRSERPRPDGPPLTTSDLSLTTAPLISRG